MTIDLHNDHNVYVIGAGFSADANYPLLADFLDTMRDSRPWLASAGRKLEVDSVDRVFEFRLNSSAAAHRLRINLENIEDLFSLAAATTPSIQSEISWSIAATIDFAKKHRPPKEWSMSFQPGAVTLPRSRRLRDRHNTGRDIFALTIHEHALLVLSGALAGAGSSENTFISLNYDTLVEDACDTLGIAYDLALPDFECVATRIVPSVRPVTLLKLHGSVTWNRIGDSLGVHRSYDDTVKTGSAPEIVPPTWGKTFGKELASVWERASKALESATRLIFIGYSFPPTDIHMKFLLGAGLQRNVSLRGVFVADKNADQLRARIQNLFQEDSRLLQDQNFVQSAFSDVLFNSNFLGAIGRNPFPISQGRDEIRP